MSPEVMSPEKEEKMRRFTMHKRPASNKVVTADKGDSSPLYYLGVEPSISGYLFKNNRRGKWQVIPISVHSGSARSRDLVQGARGVRAFAPVDGPDDPNINLQP